MLLVRGATELLIAVLLTSSWTLLGRRLVREIGLSVLLLLGAMMIVLNRLQDGQLQVGFTGSFMMVFLAYLMFPHVGSWKVVGALSLSTDSITRAIIEQQTTLFVCGIVLTALSVRFSERLQRAEFYGRRRLEQANHRLARFENGGAVTAR